MTNNLQLVKDCLQNNRQAQQQLYKLYAPALLGVCYRYTKSIEDAEDVLQEGFIKIFKNLDKYRNEGELAAWMRRIIVNTALTYLNKHSRYKKEMIFDAIQLHPVTDENPEINLNTKQLIETIRKLPAGYQAIFNLVAVEGYSHVEVTGLLNMNINTVRSQYKRARSMIIKNLENQSSPNINYNER